MEGPERCLAQTKRFVLDFLGGFLASDCPLGLQRCGDCGLRGKKQTTAFNGSQILVLSWNMHECVVGFQQTHAPG